MSEGKNRMSLQELKKRLDIFETEINSRREGNMHNSSKFESVKASLMLERTNLNYSNALFISAIGESPHMSRAESKEVPENSKPSPSSKERLSLL